MHTFTIRAKAAAFLVLVSALILGGTFAYADTRDDIRSLAQGTSTPALIPPPIPSVVPHIGVTLPSIVPLISAVESLIGTASGGTAASSSDPLLPVVPPITAPSVTVTLPTAGGSSSTTHLDLGGGSISTIGSRIGCFVKFETLAGLGWPLPQFPNDCAGASPGNAGALVVIKMVNGGTATSSDFSMHVSIGTSTTDVNGSPRAGDVLGSMYILPPGMYFVSETGGPSGYTASFSGACAGGVVLVAANATVTCVVTNTFETGGGGTNPGPGGGGTPPGPGGGGTNPGPGGGGTNPGPGGGGNPGGSDVGSGGGSTGGGGNPGGGSTPPGEVLGESTSTPSIPNTGAGGNSAAAILTLFLSGLVALGGLTILYRRTAE